MSHRFRDQAGHGPAKDSAGKSSLLKSIACPFDQFPLLLIPAIPLVSSAVISSPQVIAYPLAVRPATPHA